MLCRTRPFRHQDARFAVPVANIAGFNRPCRPTKMGRVKALIMQVQRSRMLRPLRPLRRPRQIRRAWLRLCRPWLRPPRPSNPWQSVTLRMMWPLRQKKLRPHPQNPRYRRCLSRMFRLHHRLLQAKRQGRIKQLRRPPSRTMRLMSLSVSQQLVQRRMTYCRMKIWWPINLCLSAARPMGWGAAGP